jgi:hypothetical protein
MYNYKITLLLLHKYIQNLERNVDGDMSKNMVFELLVSFGIQMVKY